MGYELGSGDGGVTHHEPFQFCGGYKTSCSRF